MLSLFQQGGPVMLAIAALSLGAWALIAWKWLQLRDQFRDGVAWAEQALAAMSEGRQEQALRLCREHENCVGRLMQEAIAAREPDRTFFEKHIQPLVESEAVALRRHLPTIGVLGSLSPLLGLLGTVLGMVATFDVLAVEGARDTSSLADGISQALLTTQAGLLMALPILLLHGWLLAKVNHYIGAAQLYLKKIETLKCYP